MAELTFLQGGNVRALLEGAGVIDVLAARIPSELRQAFVDAGTGGGLREFLDQERDELAQKLPADAQFLVTKLEDFDQQSFDLLELTKSTATDNGKFGASAGATILLDRIDTEHLEGEVGFAVGDDQALLKLELKGSLSGAVELKGKTGLLSVGLSFGAGTEQVLAYYFAADPSAYVATVLPRFKELIFDPSNLDELVGAMSDHGLLRVERRADSTATLGFKVGISQQIGSMVAGLPAVGEIGGSLSVEYRDAAMFSLIVDRVASDRFIIEFRKTRRKERSSVLKLGVDVQITGLRDKVREELALAIPEDTKLNELLAELDELTGKLQQDVLKTRLQEALLERWPEGAAAIAVLVGKQTATELAEKIRTELQDKIEDTIDAKIDLLNTKSDVVARTVASEIAEALGLTGTDRNELEQYVGGAVEKAVRAFGERIDGAVSDLVSQGRLEALLRPWQFVGDAVSRGLEALSESSHDKVARARAALATVHERYTRLRQGVLTAVKDKMEEEFSISVVSEKQRTDTHTRTVRYEFREADAGATALYDALWTGDLRDLQTLLKDLNPANTVSLAGEYVLVATNLAKRSLAVNFFGLKLGATNLFSSTVEVGIDLNGRLIVAKSRAELDERRKRGGESQVVTATWQIDYLRNQLLDTPLLIKLVLADGKFKNGKEVENFFGPLELVEAMRPGVSTDVETKLFGPTGKLIKDATLTINVMLRWDEWLELVGVDLKCVPVTDAWLPDDVCSEFLRSVETLARPYITASRKVMRQTNHQKLLPFLLELGSKGKLSDATRFVGESPKHRSLDFGTSWRLAKAVASLNNGLTALQKSWKTLVTELLAAPPLNDDDLENLRDETEEVNDAFVAAFEGVLSTGLFFDDVGKVAWPTAATLNLFRSRSNLPNPFLTCTFQSEETGQLLFS